MKILLRMIAAITGLAVVVTALSVWQAALAGRFSSVGGSGVLGFMAVGVSCALLVAGPFASVQLWRLRRVGLLTTALLGTLLATYYLAELFVGPSVAPVAPIVARLLAYTAAVALVLSPGAKRTCGQLR